MKHSLYVFSDLVSCHYYVTSESTYNHFIPYVNITDPNSGHLISLKFYSLAGNTIKVKLAASNHSTPINIPEDSGSSSHREIELDHDNTESYSNDMYMYRSSRRIAPTTIETQKPIIYVAKGRTETHTHDMGYEISK